ncbi:NUDIX hydrolase [Actinomadura rugatobispora]|uniref:NUDIX hydrolase n=1 Tax=Actinomadura rugatobispora TaxID=1994 RepID=A0ABW0ZVR7_9ACTN|nr:NUDIX hydrolase [Actinomadura rugatobispora]
MKGPGGGGGAALAVDGDGNELTRFERIAETGLAAVGAEGAGDGPLTLSLVAVWCGGRLLMVFGRHRQAWELPGGMIEAGEGARAAAVRELREETGLRVADPVFAGRARFVLGAARLVEYAAVYSAQVGAEAERASLRFVPDEEIAAVGWWEGSSPRDGQGGLAGRVQPLDVALGLLAARPPRR